MVLAVAPSQELLKIFGAATVLLLPMGPVLFASTDTATAKNLKLIPVRRGFRVSLMGVLAPALATIPAIGIYMVFVTFHLYKTKQVSILTVSKTSNSQFLNIQIFVLIRR